METVINTLATGLGDGIGWAAEHGILLLAFGALWVAFGLAVVASQGTLDDAWATLTRLPLIVQAVVWLLLLPVVAGLWIWETTWPFVVRVVLVLGVAATNLLLFLPKAAQTPRP
jgi:hypothetical protein